MSLECNNEYDIIGDDIDPKQAIVFLREGVPVYNCLNRDTFFKALETEASSGNYISVDYTPQYNEILFKDPWTRILIDKSIYAFKFNRVFFLYKRGDFKTTKSNQNQVVYTAYPLAMDHFLAYNGRVVELVNELERKLTPEFKRENEMEIDLRLSDTTWIVGADFIQAKNGRKPDVVRIREGEAMQRNAEFRAQAVNIESADPRRLAQIEAQRQGRRQADEQMIALQAESQRRRAEVRRRAEAQRIQNQRERDEENDSGSETESDEENDSGSTTESDEDEDDENHLTEDQQDEITNLYQEITRVNRVAYVYNYDDMEVVGDVSEISPRTQNVSIRHASGVIENLPNVVYLSITGDGSSHITDLRNMDSLKVLKIQRNNPINITNVLSLEKIIIIECEGEWNLDIPSLKDLQVSTSKIQTLVAPGLISLQIEEGLLYPSLDNFENLKTISFEVADIYPIISSNSITHLFVKDSRVQEINVPNAQKILIEVDSVLTLNTNPNTSGVLVCPQLMKYNNLVVDGLSIAEKSRIISTFYPNIKLY
jgi:hypothetical protein